MTKVYECYRDSRKEIVRVGDKVHRFTWEYDRNADNGRGRSWIEVLPGVYTVTEIYRDGGGYRVRLDGAEDHKATWTTKI